MRRIFIFGIVAVLLAVFAVQPVVGKTLKWGDKKDINAMDPYARGSSDTLAFLAHVYEPLVRYSIDLKFEPALATSWEIIEPTIWRFNLRKGVKYHNGNPFNADDVVASIKRVTHPNSGLRGNLPAVTDVRKIDDHTVDLILKGPYPLLRNDLTNIYIMDKEWMVANDCLEPADIAKGGSSYASTHSNGTGPFIQDSRTPDAKTVLVVNPDWWDTPKHNLTRIEFLPIQSDATRVSAMLSGEINFTNVLPLQDAQRVANAPGIQVMEGPSLRIIMLNLRIAAKELKNSNIKGKNPLADVRVRKALYQAIDMDLIRKKIMRGKSRNCGLLVAPEIPGYVASLDERYPYDPAAAKKLLAAAGYPDGFQLGFGIPNNKYMNDDEIGQAIASMWAKVGINPKVEIYPGSIYNKKYHNGEFDVFMMSWATLPMMDSYSLVLQILATQTGSAGVFNIGGYYNARVDEIVEQAGVELDNEKRLKMMSEALKYAKDEIALIPLHQQPLSWAAKDNVTVIQTPDNKVRLWHARIK
jgi:peptide/nickel transport system substrate-binding protein